MKQGVLQPGQRSDSILNRNFICVFFIQMLFSAAFNMIAAYVADYSYQLGAAAGVAGFLSGMANGVAVFLKPVTVPMQVRVDKLKLLRFSCLLGVVACVGYVLSPSVLWFMLFHFVSGAQVSITVSLTLTIASESVPVHKLTSGLAVFGLGGSLGNTFGPMLAERVMLTVSGLADKERGFAAVFLLGCVFHVVSILLTFFMRLDPEERKPRSGSAEPWYRQIFEMKALVPALMLVLIFASYRLPNAYLLLYCEELGLPTGGSFFLIQGFVLIATRLLMGKLLDRLNATLLYLVSAGLFAAGFYLIGFAGGMAHLLIASVLLAIAIGVLQPVVQTMCIRSTDDSRRTIACNTSSIGTDFGCFIGPALLGGQVYAITGRYASIFRLAIVPVVLSMGLLFLFLYQQKKRRNTL